MTTAPIADLKNRLSHYLRLVARGERVTILDRGRPVGQITPLPSVADSVRDLVALGLARAPHTRLPAVFWRRPLPKPNRSVLAALIEDRADRSL
jgi:prevent-host-death family protein